MSVINQNTINEIVRRIVEAVNPDRIIMIGSRARGSEHSESDLDLVVIVSGDIHRRNTAQKIYMNLIGVGCSIDIIVLKPEDLEKYKDSNVVIVPTVLKEGKELYVA